MDIQAIWAAAEPYVMAIVGALGGGTVIYTLARTLMNKLLNKFSAKYDMDDMADKVAKKLAGKTLNVDVTAVTEKRLDKIENKLRKQVDQLQEQTAAYRQLLTAIGAAVAHFKSLTEEERGELQAAIQALDHRYTPPAPEEIVTVKLEPIALEPDHAEELTTEPEHSLIDFGGLRKA